MKYLVALMLWYFLIGCKSDESEQRFYSAVSKESKAVLAIKFDNGQFHGQYKVQYADNIIDSGEVRGIVIGDTLRGRFNYISYGGSKEVKPFLLLRRGDTLKLGSGATYTYMKIPYYTPESIEFKNSSFQFLPISVEDFERLNVNMK